MLRVSSSMALSSSNYVSEIASAVPSTVLLLLLLLVDRNFPSLIALPHMPALLHIWSQLPLRLYIYTTLSFPRFKRGRQPSSAQIAPCSTHDWSSHHAPTTTTWLRLFSLQTDNNYCTSQRSAASLIQPHPRERNAKPKIRKALKNPDSSFTVSTTDQTLLTGGLSADLANAELRRTRIAELQRDGS